jgi:hypothetical protein
MPSKKTRAAGPVVVDSADPTTTGLLDTDEPFQLIDEDTKEIITNPALANAVWIRKVMDPQLKFFDALTDIPAGGWDVVNLYLYRLEPKIANREGQEKYIGCYGSPITQESVKTEHGGGKYQIYLKAGKHTLRNHRFWIDGEPRYQEGQTVRGGPTAGTPLIGTATVLPPGQDIASIVRQVIEATGGNSKAADAGIDVMKRAFTDGLDLQKSISNRQLDSTTGSSLGDKLFDSLLPRLLAPPTTDPIILKLVEAAISNMKADRREVNPSPVTAPVPPSEQFALVKEVLGVESLRDVFDMTRGNKEQPWWVAVVSNAIEKLPSVLNEFAQMQERSFQRAVIAHQLGAGIAPPGAPVIPAGPVAPLVVPPRVAASPSPQPVPANANISEQMIQGIVEGICRAYDEGYEGDMAATHLKLLYPQLLDSLRPLLSDPVQLSNFVTQIPTLAERARDAEWPEFQQQFIEEVRQVPMQDMPGANESRIAAEIPHDDLAATAAPGKPPKPIAASRKKANGAVA